MPREKTPERSIRNNKILLRISLFFITVSVSLLLILSFVTNERREMKKQDMIENIVSREENIPSYHIIDTKKISQNYYEVHLENGDIYFIQFRDEDNYVISRVESVKREGVEDSKWLFKGIQWIPIRRELKGQAWPQWFTER